MEAAAPKVGNVHPGAAFDDLQFSDFVTSAEVVSPILGQSVTLGVGQSVLNGVRATSDAVGSNTNLGILLLLAPLAAVSSDVPLAEGIGEVLSQLSMKDSQLIYEAIRLAHPGGLGSTDKQDVAEAPTISIVEAMSLAAERDRIAKQYSTDFEDVLNFGVNAFLQRLEQTPDCLTAIVGLQLTLLATWPDSLIARKNGIECAEESSLRAQQVLDSCWPGTSASHEALAEFDVWLRADGHRRNPGTTADLIAAILFAAIRDKHWTPPSHI